MLNIYNILTKNLARVLGLITGHRFFGKLRLEIDMKGVVFNIFEKFIKEKFGESFLFDVMNSSRFKSQGVFVGPGTYPDTDLFEMISQVTEKANLTMEEILQDFGKFMFQNLIKKYPFFVEDQKDLKSFLKSVDSIIHVEVHKLYPDSITPKFTYEENGDCDLSVTYKSSRNLPDLFVGLTLGAAEYYQQEVEIERNAIDPVNGIWKFDISITGTAKKIA